MTVLRDLRQRGQQRYLDQLHASRDPAMVCTGGWARCQPASFL